ncbi:hypothetical protein [Hyphococcus luteus]|uniref:Uncharacterized protein n=1 Tax=Hyphococcus luteus TaxID=2058213 RepID=A0A2S7K479_9PROT|nr:hypothetical protein [Marinicaulis flavus]PQA87248.1 hypothetical protein CW354_12505 [Marinicaulis flavus]
MIEKRLQSRAFKAFIVVGLIAIIAAKIALEYMENPADFWTRKAVEWGDAFIVTAYGLICAALTYGAWIGLSRLLGGRPLIKSLAVIALIFLFVFLFFPLFMPLEG